MGRNIHFIVVALVSLFIVLCLHYECMAQNGIPVKSGDFFEYKMFTDKEISDIYEIEEVGNKEYKVTWSMKGDFGKKLRAEFIIDMNGKIIKAPSNFPPAQYLEKQIILWLPDNKRKIGETMPLSGFEKQVVIISEKKWKEWDVWVAEYKNTIDMFGDKLQEQAEVYFDKKTGFLVGQEFPLGFSFILKESKRPI